MHNATAAAVHVRNGKVGGKSKSVIENASLILVAVPLLSFIMITITFVHRNLPNKTPLFFCCPQLGRRVLHCLLSKLPS